MILGSKEQIQQELEYNLHLFSTEDKPLLWWRNSFFLFNSLFYPFNLEEIPEIC